MRQACGMLPWVPRRWTGARAEGQRRAEAGFGADSGDIEKDCRIYSAMIRKLKSGEYRLYSRKKDESTGKRRNLGTFSTREKAQQHEREVQYFKKH
jgi:hypothetical protein